MKCQRANEHLDVIVIEGNGSDAQVLKNANVDDADYVFCVTSSDETNLIASMQSHNLGAKKIVARLRNTDYSNNGDSIHPEKFGVEAFKIKRYLPNTTDEFPEHVDVRDRSTARRFLVMFAYLTNNEAGETEISVKSEYSGPDYEEKRKRSFIISPCKQGSILLFPYYLFLMMNVNCHSNKYCSEQCKNICLHENNNYFKSRNCCSHWY